MSFRGVGIGIKKSSIEAVIREQTGVEVDRAISPDHRRGADGTSVA